MAEKTERKFRAKIVGRSHPHRGARGTCDPNQTARGMVLVTFDSTENRGADGCFADVLEVRRLEPTDAAY